MTTNQPSHASQANQHITRKQHASVNNAYINNAYYIVNLNNMDNVASPEQSDTLPASTSTPRPSSPSTTSTALFQLPPPTHADRNTSTLMQDSRKLTKISDAQKASLKI